MPWHTYRIVAIGPRLQHFINGALMCEVEDLDPGKRRLSGLLGVQVHVGPPMKIEYRRIGLKRLEPAAGSRPAAGTPSAESPRDPQFKPAPDL